MSLLLCNMNISKEFKFFLLTVCLIVDMVGRKRSIADFLPDLYSELSERLLDLGLLEMERLRVFGLQEMERLRVFGLREMERLRVFGLQLLREIFSFSLFSS